MNKRFMKMVFVGVVLFGVSAFGLASAPLKVLDFIGFEFEREYMCSVDDDCDFVTNDYRHLLAHEQSH